MDERINVDQLIDTDQARASSDHALRALFPGLANKQLADQPVPVSLSPVVEVQSFSRYESDFPLDWSVDPYGDRTWRFAFQSFHWLGPYTLERGGNPSHGLAIVADWVDHGLFRSDPLEWTFYDHAFARRLNRTTRLLDDYVAQNDALDRQTLTAVAKLIGSHLFAMGTEACYGEGYNHGFIQDVAILEHVGSFPKLRESDALRDLAEERLLRQVDTSVTADGIHTENSPGYQQHFLGLLLRAIEVMETRGDAPDSLIATRDGMIHGLVHLLQPDFSLPQFGDTTNNRVERFLRTVAVHLEAFPRGEKTARQELDWVLSKGDRGTRPALDRVFKQGGYASFRDGWGADAIVGHLSCNRHSPVHYHQDETSITVFGFGQELIADSGHHSFAPSAYTSYSTKPWAHNLLVVDGLEFEITGASRIVASGVGDDMAWVQASHEHYRRRGIQRLVRTFAHAKPELFAVVDHVRTDGVHDYAQYFHLHPSLSDVRVVNDGQTVIASSPGGPSLVLHAAQLPSKTELAQGTQDGQLRAWHFPMANERIPATGVVFHHLDARGKQAFAVAIAVLPPGTQPGETWSLSYRESKGEMVVVAGGDAMTTKTVRVPLP